MAANYQLSKNIWLADLIKTSQPFPNVPNEAEKKNLQLLVDNVLQPVFDLIPGVEVTNSAFRSEQVNKAVGGVPNSQHRLGLACDFHTTGISLEDAFNLIKRSKIPYDQLILETGSRGERWIHVSYSSTPRRAALIANWSNTENKMVYSKA